MLGKPFSSIDWNNEEEFRRLLYCVLVSNNNPISFEDFLSLIDSSKLYSEMISLLEKENAFINQFMQTIQAEGENEDNKDAPPYIKDIVSALILSGIDAHFAYEEMSLSDISHFVDAYEKAKREEMESRRLWAYLTVLPHVDGKKMNNPKKLMLFPWEEEEEREKALADMEKNSALLDKFLSGELKI